jgi:Outer membrane protein beta-barrel domain
VSKTTLVLTIVMAIARPVVFAQDSKLNTNLGMGVGPSLNPTAAIVGAGLNVVVGAGYNFTKHHSVVGQFMWNALPVHKDALGPIFIVAQRNDISGSSNLFAFTGNYRYQREGKRFGSYLIGGGGVYYRRAQLSQDVVVGTGTVCSPTWIYWGFTCTSGVVTEDQSLLKAGSTAGGVNGGAGFTIRINDEGYKFYVEARYHYAWTKNLPTTIIPVTLGFSW